ncbi:HlyD family efflux transporter periplasmic adaptor subunit [uncultured Gammaproteobacteria bacterium]
MTALAQAAASSVLPILLGLEQRARRARTLDELQFVMVNETVSLVRYRQGVLWHSVENVVAVSGVAGVETDAPFTQWLNRLLGREAEGLTAPRRLAPESQPEPERIAWTEWLPGHLLLMPLVTPDGTRLGLLALARDEPWSEAETLFLADLCEGYAFAWSWWLRPTFLQTCRSWWRRLPRRHILLALAVVLLGLVPVRLTVLAPAEAVARDPAVVRSPLDGVVDRVLVKPNQSVTQGQPLFDLDTTTIRGKMEVAEKALATARAEYEQAAQQAFSDMKAKAQLGVLAGRIEERQAERTTLAHVLARARVTAPRAGVAVLDDPSEWAGRPVAVGEKVLTVAEERDTEIEAWLAPADLIELTEGAPLTLFLNTDPLHAIHARLRMVGYESQYRPDGTLAHRVRATLAEGEAPPRLGLKGTARLDGERVTLAYWLFRRPLAIIRQTLGW